jgi:hypothetical protein
MAQFPFFTPLASSLLTSLPFPFTYLETLLWREAILSTLAPGCSQTDLPLSIPSPFPIPNSQHLWSIVRLTKTTSRSRLLMVRNRYLAPLFYRLCTVSICKLLANMTFLQKNCLGNFCNKTFDEHLKVSA